MKTPNTLPTHRPDLPPVRTGKYVLYQFLILGALIALTFLNEALDLPHYLLGSAPTSVAQRWGEIVIEVVSYTVIVGIEILLVGKLYSEIRFLQGFITICPHCQKVRNFGDWVRMETYVSEHSTAHFSHSLCPECLRTAYPYLAEDVDEEGASAQGSVQPNRLESMAKQA